MIIIIIKTKTVVKRDCIDIFDIANFVVLEGNGNHVIQIYVADQKKRTSVNYAYLTGVHLLVCYLNLNIPLLSSSSSSSSLSPLCRVSTHTFPRQTMSLGNTLLQLFCLVYGASISSSCVGSFVLLRYHFPQYVCSAQYGCFL
jgi:hypothetical protein